MFRNRKIKFCIAALASVCLVLTGCGNKTDDAARALETKKIAEAFIASYNSGDADACIKLLSPDIVVEQKALQDIKSQDERSVHESLKNNIALKHTLKILKYLHSTESGVTMAIEESGSEMQLVGMTSISYEESFEVKDGKITRIVTVIDKKLAEQLAAKTDGGIGIKTNVQAGATQIIGVAPNSPADKAGLKPGDEIVAVEGVLCSEMKPGEPVLRIRGPVGSKVLLKLRHGGSNATVDVEIIRADLSTLQKN